MATLPGDLRSHGAQCVMVGVSVRAVRRNQDDPAGRNGETANGLPDGVRDGGCVPIKATVRQGKEVPVLRAKAQCGEGSGEFLQPDRSKLCGRVRGRRRMGAFPGCAQYDVHFRSRSQQRRDEPAGAQRFVVRVGSQDHQANGMRTGRVEGQYGGSGQARRRPVSLACPGVRVRKGHHGQSPARASAPNCASSRWPWCCRI
ncbi:hypothetical protein ARTHROSP310_18620 [Arthrobacter sp. AD-310]